MSRRRWPILLLLLVVPALVAAALVVRYSGDEPVSDDGDDQPSPPATAVTGTVTGTVTTAGGGPVPEAAVLPTSVDEPARPVPDIGVLTGPDGEYEWSLRPGRYEFAVYVDGELRDATEVTVVAGQEVTLDFRLP